MAKFAGNVSIYQFLRVSGESAMAVSLSTEFKLFLFIIQLYLELSKESITFNKKISYLFTMMMNAKRKQKYSRLIDLKVYKLYNFNYRECL